MELLYMYILLLCCCTIGVRSQIFDFFQGLQFGDSPAFSRPKIIDDVTTKRTTRKNTKRVQNYGQTTRKTAVSYENIPKTTEQKKKETTLGPLFDFNSFLTSPKPFRKTIKNNNREVITNKNTWTNSQKNNEIIQDFARPNDFSRPIITDNYDNNRNINRDRNDNFNEFITFNESPFVHKPGVKPATVDLSRPPITNRPVNHRPNYPTPNYNENSNINSSYNDESPHFNRPINDRPTFDRPNDRPNYDAPTYTVKPTYTERPGYDSYIQRPTQRPRPSVTQKQTERPRPSYVNPTEGDGIAFPVDRNGPDVISGVDEDTMSSADRRRHLTIAEQMCNKYKSLTTTTVEAIPLIPSPEPIQVNVSQCAPINIPLIVGGKVVSIREFPHMALIGWKNILQAGYSWKCGGSLISDRFVLTAAHCAYQDRDDNVVSGAPRVVQLGSSLLGDPRAKIVPVSSVIQHPKYKPPSSYYDLALLELKNKVQFTELIRPACLGSTPKVGTKIIATGWGRTQTGGDQSVELRSVSLPVWDFPTCRQVLGTSRKLPNGPDDRSQICAGDSNGGKDTCQGDSGGPAQIQDGCQWRVVAVTSIGRSCGAANTPGLYATVQTAFISAHVFKNEKINDNNNDEHNNNRQDNYNKDNVYQNNDDRQDNYNNNDNSKPYVYPSNNERPDTIIYNSENNNRNNRGAYGNTQQYFNNDNYYHHNKQVSNNYHGFDNNQNYRNDGPLW